MTVRWPLRPRTRDALLELVSVARPLVRGRWWPLLALAVGTVPLLIGLAIASSLHQIATGLLLGPLFWACIRDDRLSRAIGITALVIMSHSVLAIALAAHQPERMAAILPGSADYWQRTRHWIQTGDDPEYRIAEWLPFMEMGGREGIMITNATGDMLGSFDELPAVMKDEIKANYPIYTAPPPLDDARPNETSWTYFKKMVDAKKAAAK